MNICILIPAHNESATVGGLVEALCRQQLPVVVVDDGSSDQTATLALEKGAVVLRNETRRGKGFSLQRGFEYVLVHSYDGVMTMDGDGQHDPADLKYFFEKIKDHPDAIVTGNRMFNPKGMPWLRRLTNRVMSTLISFVCRQSIPDTQCGFRFISREVLKNLHLGSANFEIETEVLVQACKKGATVHSVPVRTIYRGEESKIRPGRDTGRFLVYIMKELFTRR